MKGSGKKVTVVGFGPRLLSTLIDGSMVAFLGFVLALVVSFIAIFIFKTDWQNTSRLEIWVMVSVALFSIFYYVGSWTGGGQTLGKTIVGLKVTASDGSHLTTGKALLRYFGYIINAIPLSIGFLWAAFDPKRQGWHDKIAGTVVVYEEENFSPEDTVEFVPSDLNRKGWVWGFLWIFSTLLFPIGGLAGLITVGPFVTLALINFFQK